MNENRPFTKRKVFAVRDVDGTLRELVSTESAQDLEGGQEVITLGVCESGGEIIHNIQEVGGTCNDCGALLCAKCTKVTCDLCGLPVCRLHLTMTANGKKACSRHGFIERLLS